MEANEHQLSISEQQMMTLCSQHERDVVQLQGELQQMKLQCRKVKEEAQRVASTIFGSKEAANVSVLTYVPMCVQCINVTL